MCDMDRWKEVALGGLALVLIGTLVAQSEDAAHRAYPVAYVGGALIALGVAMWWVKAQRDERRKRRDARARR